MSGSDQISLFDASTGTQLAVVRVGSGGHFSVDGGDTHWAVFHIGRTISALNVHSHKVIRLARAAADPLGLSVSGHRVAWVENIHRRGRVRALELPS